MILRLSQKLSTKIKAGKLNNLPLDYESVRRLVLPSIHGESSTVHHAQQYRVFVYLHDVR